MSALFKGWRPPAHRVTGPARMVIAYKVSGRVYRDYMKLSRYAAYREECLARPPYRWAGHPAMLVGDLTVAG